MAWLQLTVEVSAADAEALSDALMEVGALSASIEDAYAGTNIEQPIFGEPGEISEQFWQNNRVVALLEESANAEHILSAACKQIGLTVTAEYQIQLLAEQDWVRLTQAQFDPIRISARLWITPTWHNAPDPEAINLQLDPGLAFGTGSHPTTHLCLDWLDQNIKGGESILDYGCGSGILTIAALKLGAQSAVGTDIDPQAIQASIDNAAQNNVHAKFYLPDALPERKYDIVVANILANPLRMLGELLANKVNIAGRIILSGILDEQAEELGKLYSKWFDMELPIFDSGWTRLCGTRRKTP